MFSNEEKIQYSRHFLLEKIGTKGQEKLKKSRVLVIGAGGLGCPILQYLAAAGVGNIGIVDGDTVDKSNLQRQILFTQKDIGTSKALRAQKHLLKNNPYINIEAYNFFLSTENALSLFEKYDIIIDGSDNFQTRYLTNDAAVISGRPLVFGAIFKFEGQVSVFNYKGGATYRCLFPTPPVPHSVPNCAQVGVLGVLPGLIGCLQANEALKIICGLGGVLSGKLLTLDAISLTQHIIRFQKNERLKISALQKSYDAFCGIKPAEENENITLESLRDLINGKKPPTLLDVRGEKERAEKNIGGVHIPLQKLPDQYQTLENFSHIICYCASGQRSRTALNFLKEKYPYKKIQHLAKGLQ